MQRAFTLIELLVVISIVSLLSSIVLTSVQSARVQARNAYTIQTIKQYEIALEMYINDNGEYPHENTDTNGYLCMGAFAVPGNNCFGGTAPLNGGTAKQQQAYDLQESLLEYFPTLPPVNLNEVVNGFSGGKYRSCKNYSIFPKCEDENGYLIEWYLETDNQSCGPGQEDTSTNNPLYTHCYLNK